MVCPDFLALLVVVGSIIPAMADGLFRGTLSKPIPGYNSSNIPGSNSSNIPDLGSWIIQGSNSSSISAFNAVNANMSSEVSWGQADWICRWMPWAPQCQRHWQGGRTGRTGGRGSCATYGCFGYVPSQPCQCNSRCADFRNCCRDYQAKCARPAPAPAPAPAPSPSPGSGVSGGIKTLYHQTSPEVAKLILAGGFKPGKEGWCGGAIYFAVTPAATYTKAIGPDSHTGFIIEAQVDVGKVLQMSSKCDRSMTGDKLKHMGYDSVNFNPGDGAEVVVYSNDRVKSTKQYVK